MKIVNLQKNNMTSALEMWITGRGGCGTCVQARLQEITSPYFTRSKIKVYSFEMRLIMIVKITETHSDYSTNPTKFS